MKQFALMGNPNCGKSTLFNRLTGTAQKVGNWPGVTVAKKTGIMQLDQPAELIDLPGIYSLTAYDELSDDQRVTMDYLATGEADMIVNVIDAAHLERQLYLTAQLLEYQIPMIVVLNMQDVARRRNIHIDTERLTTLLGCPVVSLVAHIGDGITALTETLQTQYRVAQRTVMYPEIITQAMDSLRSLTPTTDPIHLLHVLEGDQNSRARFDDNILHHVQQLQADIVRHSGEEADILIANARYEFIHQLSKAVVHTQGKEQPSWSEKLDRIVLHRYLGIPIFLAVMYLTFILAINFGNIFQDFFSLSSQALFIDAPVQLLKTFHLPPTVLALISGVGMGLHTTVTFIPIIFTLFMMLSTLESTGYMARAAFVMDKLMSLIGLPGKAFLPLIIGLGCNVPAIMASRTLDTERERIITILMAPFMSCSARLAVFSVFVTAFFPSHGASVIFSLYLIGILCALLTGLMLQLVLKPSHQASLVFELPSYHRPNLRNITLASVLRLKSFIVRAGKIIVPVCAMLTALDQIHTGGSQHSILAQFGQWLTPWFAPIGIHADNWPATVGLITGTLAKEVLIGSLNTMYSELAHVGSAPVADQVLLTLQHALWSIPHNAIDFLQAFNQPIAALAPQQAFDHTAYGEFVHRFASWQAAYAYLIFVLLYIPCVSTFAVTVRELNWSMAWFGLLWSVGVAYTFACIFYQLTQLSTHPLHSTIVLACTAAIIVSSGLLLKRQRTRLMFQEVA